MPHRFDNTARPPRHRLVRGVALALALAALPQVVRAQGVGVAADVSGAAAAPPRPKPFAAFSASAMSLRDSLVRIARAQVGRRYVLGGTTPDRGFDCSGLVRYVMAALKLDLPRTAARQATAGTSVGMDTAQLRPGDLLAFGRGRSVSHVGIYIGNGRYVHASSIAGRVIESPIDRPPSRLIKKWRDTRRVVADSTTLADQQ